MKLSTKLGINIAALVLGITASYLFESRILKNEVRKTIQPYVENHLTEIIHEQEEKLGIQHYGVPKIEYETKHLPKGLEGNLVFGSYSPSNNTIYLPFDLAVTPETNLQNILFTILNFFGTHDVRRTLNHELGHFYLDQLSEVLEVKDFLTYTEDKDDNLRKKLISEGVAGYFERKMSGSSFLDCRFEDSDWPRRLEHFWTHRVIFEGGLSLVTPIIDKFGRRGIEYLILNPPSLKDLGDMPGYLNRVMQTLASN